jgi:uncharacterized protein (TIGR03435 family)
MRVLFGRLTVAALLSTGVVAQSPAPVPSFDVADVHVRPHSTNPFPQSSGGFLRGSRYDLRNATMLDLISRAYAVSGDTVLGGPNWLARNRFDIIARAPEGTPSETLQLMLQALLADRFKLILHKDTKPVPAYILKVSGTPKLKAGAAPTDDDAKKQPCQSPATPPAQTSSGVPFGALSCHGATMENLAEVLPGYANAYVSTRVVDQTGLKGNWDFDLKWTPRGMLGRAGSEGISLPAALEQLGLKVTYDQAPAPVLVVDSVNDTPTANPSGIAENLPAAPPAEFDVADIKVAAPDTQLNGNLQPNGRLDFQGATMKMLFQIAWNITDDDLLAGAPKWFDTTKYTLVAKTSAVVNDPKNPNNVQLDPDDARAMLRALLIERFKIVTHIEQRPVDAYTLVVADKVKLQPADPANRTRWFNGIGPGVKDPRDANPALSRLVTVQNMTMAQFAEDLSSIAPGYLREPVVDATAIDGAWDFVLSFSPMGAAIGGRGGDASGALAASAPTGALSLLDALPKELGLKLEQRKRPFPVVVIDHIEEQPIDR